MNEWSKESLEEMFGDNVIEQLTFLSGCTEHSYCNPSYPDLNGYIVSHEKLEKFAELIVRECVGVVNANMDDILDQSVFNPTDEMWNRARVEELVRVALHIKKHFGVKE